MGSSRRPILPGEKTGACFALTMEVAGQKTATIADSTVQTGIAVPHNCEVIAVYATCTALTNTPEVTVYNETDSVELVNANMALATANTPVAGTVNPSYKDLDAGECVTMRLVVGAGETVTNASVTLLCEKRDVS